MTITFNKSGLTIELEVENYDDEFMIYLVKVNKPESCISDVVEGLKEYGYNTKFSGIYSQSEEPQDFEQDYYNY